MRDKPLYLNEGSSSYPLNAVAYFCFRRTSIQREFALKRWRFARYLLLESEKLKFLGSKRVGIAAVTACEMCETEHDLLDSSGKWRCLCGRTTEDLDVTVSYS